MLGKKVFFIGLCVLFIGLFMLTSLGQAQAAGNTGPSHGPQCYPILFTDEGYWGMSCLDPDNNIASANLKTNGIITELIWDNTSAHMIVQLEEGTGLIWQVCDANNACVGGVYQ